MNKLYKINCIYDMETNDPDDYMTLCLLCSHPGVTLRAITLTPGSPEQVGLVKYVLAKTGRLDVKVGVPDPKKFTFPERKGQDSIISGFHYKIIPQLKPDYSGQSCNDVLLDTFKSYPDTVILTGAAVTNIANFIRKNPTVKISQWVAQGGFAGCNIVSVDKVLKKFEGQEICRTFNFCQDIKAADALLNCANIIEKRLVSKNVCHGVTYDKIMHNKMSVYKDKSPGLNLIYIAMEKYLLNKPGGKMFHDPLAACTMINNDICEFKEVEVYHVKEGGNEKFGSKEKKGTNTFISVGMDMDKFFNTMVE